MTQFSKKSNTRSIQRLAEKAITSKTSLASTAVITPATASNSYPSWQCEQETSLTHQVLMFTAGLGSSAAILATGISIIAQVFGIVLLIALLSRQWRHAKAFHLIEHHGGVDNTINEWSITSNDGELFYGKLLHRGYRSAGLLILVFRSHDEHGIYTVPVWNDSVPACAFSYLNAQLMFNTYKAAASENDQNSG